MINIIDYLLNFKLMLLEYQSHRLYVIQPLNNEISTIISVIC